MGNTVSNNRQLNINGTFNMEKPLQSVPFPKKNE